MIFAIVSGRGRMDTYRSSRAMCCPTDRGVLVEFDHPPPHRLA